jgi:hypothetical protein
MIAFKRENGSSIRVICNLAFLSASCYFHNAFKETLGILSYYIFRPKESCSYHSQLAREE